MGEILTEHRVTNGPALLAGVNIADRARIDEMTAFIGGHDDDRALAAVLPGMSPEHRAMIGAHCRFTHGALLTFPDRRSDALGDLRAYGLVPSEIQPSVVVRDRLSRRYPLDEALEVGIVHAPIDGDDGERREIELFLLAAGPGTDRQEIAADERTWSRETHIAFDVITPDPIVLSGLHAAITRPGHLICDGGGYNGHEDATVLYFRNDAAASHLVRRLELRAAGQHPDILHAHLRESTAPETPGSRSALRGGDTDDAPANRLLRSMTGAWTTQAIAVAAELLLADHIARNPAPRAGG